MYLFVEGPDDERFISTILYKNQFSVECVKYAEMKKEKINGFIRSIKRAEGLDYLFFADCDGKSIDEKIAKLLYDYSELEPSKIKCVQYEIESWYYAGITPEVHKALKLKNYTFCTDTLTKEQFNAKMNRRSDRVYIMERILIEYSINEARARNTSFNLYMNSVGLDSAV